jgi:lauroyl/myristoyl acyltransferase
VIEPPIASGVDPIASGSVPAAAAPHAPERGWSWRLLGRFHVTGVFWYRIHRWGVRMLPSPLLGVFIALFTTFFFVFLRRIRAALAANLDPVLGPCGGWRRQGRIFRSMWNFAWCLSERYERLSTTRTFSVDTEASEHWERTAGTGRGVVLVTAHLGNYEVGSMLPAQAEGRRVHLVREPEPDAEAQAFLQRVVAELAQSDYTMHFQSDDPLLGLALLEALQRGEIVAVQGDRPRSGARAVDATLFGRPFPLPAGPAALARGAGVPLLPVFVFRTGRRRYRVAFRPPIEVAATAKRGGLAAAMQRVANEIEWAIRREPHQWFCFRRLWP